MSTQAKRLALVLALAAACVFVGRVLMRDQHARALADTEAHVQAHVLPCASAQAGPQGIVISGPQGAITLQRRRDAAQPHAPAAATRWHIAAPLSAPADDVVVDAFVQAAADLTAEARIEAKPHEPALDLALFALAPPRHQVTLVYDDTTTCSLDVGEVSAYNRKLYVRRTPTAAATDTPPPVEQVDGAFAHQLTRDLHAWREKCLFIGMNTADIERAQVNLNGAVRYTVTAGDQGTFGLSGPAVHNAVLPADAMKVRQWLSALVDARADQFVSEAPDDAARKRFALYRPKHEVTLHLKNGGPRTLLLGQLKLGDSNVLFAQSEGPDGPIVRLATEELWHKLYEGPQALEDMRVLHVDLPDVRTLTVEHDGRTLSYSRTEATGLEPGRWQVAGGPPIDQEKFVAALHHLLQMRAATITTRSATADALRAGGLVVPKHTISLTAADGRPLAIVWLGNHQAGKLLVTDDAKRTIWSVYEGTAEQFTHDPQAFALPPAPSPQDQ